LAKSFGLDKPTGALIGDVDSSGPASKAGLRSGDIILQFNNQAVSDSADLPPMVAATPIGKAVPVSVLRDGKTLSVNVTVAALKTDQVAAADKDAEAQGKQILNIAVAPVPDQLREQLDLKSGGVLVADVRSGPAARAGVEAGDVILKIDGKDVTSPEQFAKIVKALPHGKPISALVQKQQGGRGFVAMTVPG